MHHFDQDTLMVELAKLPSAAQMAFAAACAARLERKDNPELDEEARALCRQAIDHAEHIIESGSAASSITDQLLQALEQSTHADDDLVACCYYVLSHTKSKSLEEAMWAARRAYDACDLIAQNDLAPLHFSGAIEAQLLAHPAVQAELNCQATDLARLIHKPEDARTVVKQARVHV